MIRLTCANCQATLEVDDAFAGGVCRCKHCGAIQTVPRAGRPAAVGSAAGGAGRGGDEPKTLYSVKSRAGLASTPSGLEELAEVVHGSGLGSGLRDRRGPGRVGPGLSTAQPRPKTGLWLGLGIGLALLVGLTALAVTLMDRPSAGPTAADRGKAAPSAGPAFAGVPLEGNKVVYLLDRGDATAAFFPALREMTLKSVRGLGNDRLFQVVLWDNGQVDAYPPLSAGYATDAEADKLTQWFDQATTGRVTDALPALKQAMANRPDTLILATGKSLQLDDAFADAVLAARGGRTVIDTFTLGDTSPDDPLRKIASGTGGKFVNLTGADLGGG